MPKLTAEVPHEVSRQIERIVRDGWFPDAESVVNAALQQFVEARSYLGDSPRALHAFAADALNDSKPEVALKFVQRAISLVTTHEVIDFALYQTLTELQLQILLVLDRAADALAAAEQARELLPNNPAIARWVEKLARPADGN